MQRSVAISILVALALALVGPAVLADEVSSIDPVAALTTYLQQANASTDTITAVASALSNALASKAVKAAPLDELVQAMIKAKVTPSVALAVAQRVDLMAQADLPFGQVMKEFRLLMKQGKAKGIVQALAQAEKFVQAREAKSAANAPSSPAADAHNGSQGAGAGKGGKK